MLLIGICVEHACKKHRTNTGKWNDRLKGKRRAKVNNKNLNREITFYVAAPVSSYLARSTSLLTASIYHSTWRCAQKASSLASRALNILLPPPRHSSLGLTCFFSFGALNHVMRATSNATPVARTMPDGVSNNKLSVYGSPRTALRLPPRSS
jgi:hypothetical protein